MATANPSVGMPDRARAVQALAVGAALVTIALTAAAFWLSYESLHQLAAGHHLTGARAWAWPAAIDAFVIVGELLVLRSALLGRRDWLAIALTAAGSAGSIALNVVSVGARVDLVTQIVAAVPPVAALLAFTALMRQLHRALAGRPAPSGPAPGRSPAPLVEQPLTPVTTAVDAHIPAIPPMPAQPPVLPPIAYALPGCDIIRPLYGPYRPGTATMRAALAAAGYTGPSSDGHLRGKMRAEVEKHEPWLADLEPEPTRLAAVAS
ncbi:hypothetical protein P3T35_003154 [Kitasatospora sp. GP30]|uniref:DUF2637 domain-containing protein n=1 Tax=Kitasatospora sp. GP30 TaxID=3035084 RepID=UPI000CCB4A36|nr:DUF2637 domain-containing protein [Kitasatospora sp. GP30]MDH6141141.1 hypothetical protein [Kitasatospora sp. GP30]